ncbi:MAG: haloacid dehalogenase type II [Chloroflexota bacterium]
MTTDLSAVKALTFDLFGTVLDLGGSLTPYIEELLTAKGSDVKPRRFWAQWRARQRIEQYQDNIMMLGHSGYLETAQRGLIYTLRLNQIPFEPDEPTQFMEVWKSLLPFPEVIAGLERLTSRYQLVALSNGNRWFLEHLAQNQIKWDFDAIFSVQSAGAFKPHPGVYRLAAQHIGLEVNECLMVSANSFDVMGARACGYRAAYVNRYDLPYEESVYQPDYTVKDFTELADELL